MATAKTKRAKLGPGPKRKRLLERRKAEERETGPAPKERELTGAQARYLRGLGHHLTPIIQVGKEGITPGLLKALKEALHAHELVKVRVLTEAPIDRKEVGAELAKRAACSVAQTLGRTVLLYKRHPNKPTIRLPKDGEKAPKAEKAVKTPARSEREHVLPDDEDDPEGIDDESE